MKKIRVYEYSGCDTCRRALKFLAAEGVDFEALPIVEKPPSEAELKAMLGHVKELKRLFNTSGQLYRELKMGEKLPGMSEGEALKLLAKHGKLIKRPFLMTPKGGAVGFDEKTWKKLI